MPPVYSHLQMKGLVSNEAVLLSFWGSETQKFELLSIKLPPWGDHEADVSSISHSVWQKANAWNINFIIFSHW